MISIATVVGARPQFVKASVISRLLAEEPYREEIKEYLIHTGQHYDYNLSEAFFHELSIREPDANLGVGSGTHAEMTGKMIQGIERLLIDHRPKAVMVYGDTDSTLAAALAAAKLGLPVIHVEAGLRSFDKKMPEEQNRVLTDHLASLLLCPTDTAVSNLANEGVVSSTDVSVQNVGDVMLDASLIFREVARKRADDQQTIRKLGITSPFRLLTLHRAENTDDMRRLSSIVEAINALDDVPIVFPIHPRTTKALVRFDLAFRSHVVRVPPVGYLDMIELESRCDCVITDSGGVQKEAYFFHKPCITLRDSTEWVETLEAKRNILVGCDPESIVTAVKAADASGTWLPLFGDGHSARYVLDAIIKEIP